LRRQGRASVGELVGATGLSQPTVSEKLAMLRHYGLVRGDREGTTVWYRLDCPELLPVLDELHRRWRLRFPDGRPPGKPRAGERQRRAAPVADTQSS
jgi:ArsR family transcriptional regulator, virulence genes transcriptional regulator